MMAALAFCFTAVSCSDDDDENITHSTTPEIAAAGTYSGTYTKILDGSDEEEIGTGTVVFSATSTAYVANVEFKSDVLGLDVSSATNITWANNGFSFHNVSSNSGLGAPFSGTIDENGNISSYFYLLVTEGRKSYTYHYYFTGSKQ